MTPGFIYCHKAHFMINFRLSREKKAFIQQKKLLKWNPSKRKNHPFKYKNATNQTQQKRYKFTFRPQLQTHTHTLKTKKNTEKTNFKHFCNYCNQFLRTKKKFCFHCFFSLLLALSSNIGDYGHFLLYFVHSSVFYFLSL